MALLLAAFVVASFQSTPAAIDPAITRADLQRTLAFLASDELQGRSTGTPEALRAAEFLAQGLARAGIAPGGDDGTYLQRVPMSQVTFKGVPKLVAWDASGAQSELVCGVDFEWSGGVPTKKRLRARAVTKDDEMMKFTDDEVALFLDGSMSDRRRWLGDGRGAGFGLIIAPGNDAAGKEPSTKPPRSSRNSTDKSALPPGSIRAHGSFLAALRAGNVKALRVECDVEVLDLPAANVIGVLRGAGTPDEPTLAEQAIAFSAHYDHIGHREPSSDPSVDSIMNGADDDASGCAAVLELAEAFGSGPKPARTLIFFFATGEEIGLVGTKWYIEHPLVPIEKTVCDLNFEMIGRPDELAGGAGKLWLTGYERSNLGPEFVARGVPVVADPRPDQNFFGRSDNYALALRGVVAQTLSSFNLHKDYHGVDDELERIDFAHMESALRAAWPAIQALGQGTLDPAWNPGGDPSKKSTPAPRKDAGK
ncbi:MAG: M20/M25/M40 family metallo-hydrolase [Planctomycetes bacterium]|nr:M20/M25/M40 family metallo-hydrolase [Planctomycetota bacterium]